MRIIHVITTLNRGGAETQLLTLSKLQARRHEVTVFSLRNNGALVDSFINSGVRVLEPQGSSSLLAFLRLRKILKSDQFDIVHAHLPRAEVLTRLALAGLKSSFFITRHNYETFIPNVRGGISSISRLLSIWVTLRASCVITISNAVKDFLERQKEVSKGTKIERIYYGYDFDAASPAKDFPKKSEKSFIVGTIARFVPQKRLDVLLNAFSQLKLDDGNYELRIVGGGNQEERLKTLERKLGIQSFTSWFPNTSDRLKLLADFDLFVLPSDYEGFGLVLLEAMQLGVPILASDNTAIREVLGSGYVGLFSTGDIKELAEKIEFFQKLSAAENESIQMYLSGRLELFQPEIMFDEVMQCYVAFMKVPLLD